MLSFVKNYETNVINIFFIEEIKMKSYFKKFSYFALAIACLFNASASEAGTLKFQKNEDYGVVRAKLLADGWKPFHAQNADTCDGDERCKNRPEMQSCAGTGQANCKFLWKKGQRNLAICTIDSPAIFANICDAPAR